MTTPTRDGRRPRWVLAFLAAVLAVLVAVFGAAPASAATTPGAQTRVGASTSAGQVVVGLSASISAGQRLGNDPLRPQMVVATGVAAETAAGTNKIYSARVLNRAAEETGPFHNFPGSFDDVIFSEGTRTVNPNYFTKPRPNLGSDSIQYRLPGEINGRSGVYEIFTRPSVSGRTELVTHRFFRPDYQ